MTIARIAGAAAATLAVSAGLCATTAGTATAATPACGSGCIEVFSPRFGTAADPRFVETVLNGVAKVGQPMILGPASSASTAADLIAHLGTVSTFYASGMVSASVNDHYGPLNAAQLEYAPSGQPTGLCVGLARRAYENESLSLQPCTVPGRTVFIVDTPDSPGTAPYAPLVVGSTDNFTHPWTMTYAGDPTDRPARHITVRHMRFTCSGTVPIEQLFGTRMGVLP